MVNTWHELVLDHQTVGERGGPKHRHPLGHRYVLIFGTEAGMALREIHVRRGISAYRADVIRHTLHSHSCHVAECISEQRGMFGLRTACVVKGLDGAGISDSTRLLVEVRIHDVALI